MLAEAKYIGAGVVCSGLEFSPYSGLELSSFIIAPINP
jgi:hypothetical protein